MWGYWDKIQTALFATWPFPWWIFRSTCEYRRELVELPDQGIIALDWFSPAEMRNRQDLGLGTYVTSPSERASLPPTAPIVMVFSGVVGEVCNVYVKRLVLHLHKWQPTWRIVVKSWRGLGVRLGSPKPETWGPQAVEDTHAAVLHIRKDYPDAPLLGTCLTPTAL